MTRYKNSYSYIEVENRLGVIYLFGKDLVDDTFDFEFDEPESAVKFAYSIIQEAHKEIYKDDE